ncbi:MAG: hypothetical protein ACK4RV_07090 [Caulobacter sp.]|jgi:hypothetical protein
MKSILAGGLALVLASAAGMAHAADLTYRAEPDSLTEPLNGTAYWANQAQCAGLFGAASQFFEGRGDAAQAEANRTLALQFANDAIARLRKDRGLTKAQAMDLISPAVLKARDDSQRVMAQGVDPKSPWNFARSSCLEINDNYRAHAS